MEIHTLLRSDIDAFDFRPEHFAELQRACPEVTLVHHDTLEQILTLGKNADAVLAWSFDAAWYGKLPQVKLVMTPAAGNDWVAPDPTGRARVIHGSFHGQILRESLLQAMLFMNHQMPAMIRNFNARQWDRNLQADSRLLSGQTAVIVGFGNIGMRCGELLTSLGMRVIGVARSARAIEPQIAEQVISVSMMKDVLPGADHIVLLLPGVPSTDGLMDADTLARCRDGAYLYNFGRGNALPTPALLRELDRLGGAFLDVVDEEPLPATSPLWDAPNLMVTPHSSCIYRDYIPCFLDEVAAELNALEKN